MTATRRPRGSKEKPKVYGFTIETKASEELSVIADRMDVSRSYLIQLLIEHVELDSAGLPTWWTPETQTTELDGIGGTTHSAA
ncbi:hypothetical protein ACFOYW_17060 [Gryllotalpicola reticulitermitis]|uniref:Ribbon-helix-helix protein CopG domain-containing protein n=1 Tax=Gryllotalpicola reticulitermitis TaxID=1184153 RepID=A0ABV8Q9Y9_9MICO